MSMRVVIHGDGDPFPSGPVGELRVEPVGPTEGFEGRDDWRVVWTPASTGEPEPAYPLVALKRGLPALAVAYEAFGALAEGRRQRAQQRPHAPPGAPVPEGEAEGLHRFDPAAKLRPDGDA